MSAVADALIGHRLGLFGSGPMVLELSRALGLEVANDYRDLPSGRHHYCVVPHMPLPVALSAASDEHLTELAGALRDCLYALKHVSAEIKAAISSPPRGRDDPPPSGGRSGSIVLVLPAAPALGQAGESLAGAFCGGLLSLARTLSIELRRERVRVNTLLVDARMPDGAASVVTQMAALMSMPGVTGQEIYLADGLDTGRIRP